MYRQTTSYSLTFRKFKSGSLPDTVKNIIEVKGHSVETSLRLYPRNTPEILINLADPIHGEMGGGKSVVDTCSIQGSKTNYVDVWHPKECHFMCVRFTPNGYNKFFGISQKILTDRIYKVDEVIESKFERLVPVLRNESSVIKRFQILTGGLKKELQKRVIPSKTLSDFIIGQLDRNPNLTVKQLVNKTGYTRKHIADCFREETGLTVKEYQKIQRFQKVRERISKKNELNWAAIACRHGYYDQSHLIKDFKRYTGLTPGGYREQVTTVKSSSTGYDSLSQTDP